MNRRFAITFCTMFIAAPKLALGQVFRCGDELKIYFLASVTGPSASVGFKQVDGANNAMSKKRTASCPADLVIVDAGWSPINTRLATIKSVKQGASVIVAPFGSALARRLASANGSVLFIDLLPEKPTTAADSPRNLLSLPYLIFEQSKSPAHDQAFMAVDIVLASTANFPESDVQNLVRHISEITFESPIGPLRLNSSTNTFELQ